MDHQTSFIELAKQHNAFLIAIATSLLAVLGIVASVGLTRFDQQKRDSKSNQIQAFLLNLLCLVVIAFAGAQCMSEVAGFPGHIETPVDTIQIKLPVPLPGLSGLASSLVFDETLNDEVAIKSLYASPGYQKLNKMFFVASIFVFLTAIGFLQVLCSLARYIDREQKPRLHPFMLLVQKLFLLVILLHLVFSVYTMIETSQISSIEALLYSLVIPLIIASALLRYIMKRPIKVQRAMILLRLPIKLNVATGSIAFGFIAIVLFICSFMSGGKIGWLELITLSLSVMVVGTASWLAPRVNQ